jgi:hypothetical protein
MPEKPRPVIARPIIKTIELGARPDIRMPASKITILNRKTHLMG